ncbi:MAG: beta-lactamase class [Rubrobacteraceae bacterium]|nr:beta-lactamase class [Rubrobacteraceae bacterium]
MVRLLDPEKLAGGTERREDLARVRRVVWRRWALQGLSVTLAVLCAWLVLLFTGGLAWERDAIETVARPAIASAPALPKVAPVLPEVAPGFDAEELRGRLEEIAEEHEGVYGVAVLEPVSGTRVSLRGDEEFMAASIGKLPTLAALYRAAARGEIDLDEEISLLPDDIQAYDSGGLNGFSLDYSMSLRECAYRLVNYSDNTAWTMLDRRLGEEKIRAELESAGIENSSYSGYLSGYYTTPSDVLLLLEKISDPQYTSEELSAEMLDAMTETSVEDRIPEKLPQDVRVAHKTGSYDDNFGDAGIVFYRDYRGDEKRYYLVVLASGTGEYEARDAIQEMSLAVYEALLYPS